MAIPSSEAESNPANKSARHYLVWFALIFVVLCSLFGAGLWLASRGEPTEILSASARHIYFWKQQKREVSEKVPGGRILLVGGSGSLYSIRASTLEKTLGGPVINLGLHAGLGLDYLLREAEQVARQGDVVVLFLEYGMLASSDPDWTLADYVIPNDLGYLLQTNPAQLLKIAGKLTPLEYGKKLIGRYFKSTIDGSSFRSMLDTRGDLVVNLKGKQQAFQRDALAAFSPFTGTAIDGVQAARLKSFIAWSRAHGVTVIAGFPAFLAFPEYAKAPYAGFFDAVYQLYVDEGVVTLGGPREFFVGRESFFDTNYHLHDEGAEAFTANIAVRLRKALVCAMPARWDPGRRQTCLPEGGLMTVSFVMPGLPKGLTALDGFAEAESWGRWTESERAALVFAQPLPRRFRMDAYARHVYSASGSIDVEFAIGTSRQSVSIGENSRFSVEFENQDAARQITLTLPKQASPRMMGLSNDDRHLGLGLESVTITPLD